MEDFIHCVNKPCIGILRTLIEEKSRSDNHYSCAAHRYIKESLGCTSLYLDSYDNATDSLNKDWVVKRIKAHLAQINAYLDNEIVDSESYNKFADVR